jgi:hypothetical protein
VTPEAEAAPAPAPTPRPKRAVRAKRKAAEKRRQPSELRGEVPAAEQPLTEQQMEATAAELAACQSDLARPQPGTLLLAQEPSRAAK